MMWLLHKRRRRCMSWCNGWFRPGVGGMGAHHAARRTAKPMTQTTCSRLIRRPNSKHQTSQWSPSCCPPCPAEQTSANFSPSSSLAFDARTAMSDGSRSRSSSSCKFAEAARAAPEKKYKKLHEPSIHVAAQAHPPHLHFPRLTLALPLRTAN
ncbi:uncharacterized protein BKA78DRAFT_110866 [Phyllosticta capitalensis]|uniref:uncharacterized protein n=1 Tax=Phyllosticta capitalensis TaxID=121624 RepID=UPI00312DABAF